MPMESNTRTRDQTEEGMDWERESLQRKMSFDDLTARLAAGSLKTSVITNTFVRGVEKEDTGSRPALQKNTRDEAYGMSPKYLRYNVWDPESDFTRNTSDWTLTAEPLEGPPQSELDDEVVKKTINENPHLFGVTTPIKIDVFESYLSSHPNQAFVDSVCKGLREGFWPWAKTSKPGYPTTNNESKPPPLGGWLSG